MRQGLLELMRPERATYRGHEPHGQGQSLARSAVTPGRDVDRRLDRRLLWQFVAALLSIPVAGALQVITRELWHATAWPGPPDSEPPAEPGPRAVTSKHPRPTEAFVTASRNRPKWR
jgi:hypothetical protein